MTMPGLTFINWRKKLCGLLKFYIEKVSAAASQCRRIGRKKIRVCSVITEMLHNPDHAP
uniref:Uncharacterized protein n=1 Tax=Anguilla anguilla TaxID=7936 RepID=A0A0E9PEL4_ANGAN